MKDDKATPERVIPEAAPLRTSLAVSLSPRTIELATKQAQVRGISLEAYLLLVLEQSLKAQEPTHFDTRLGVMKSLVAKILGITNSIWRFYGPLLRQLVISGTGALLPIALDIVRSLADSDRTSGQKREEAIKTLKSRAVTEGISATESLIRWTIESAVQRMRLEDK